MSGWRRSESGRPLTLGNSSYRLVLEYTVIAGLGFRVTRTLRRSRVDLQGSGFDSHKWALPPDVRKRSASDMKLTFELLRQGPLAG